MPQKPPAAQEAATPDYEKLVQAFAKAQSDYYAPLEKIQDQKKLAEALAKLDPKKNPTVVFRNRFEAFALRGTNRATRTAATLQMVQMLQENEKPLARKLMERAVADNVNAGQLQMVAAYLTMMDGRQLAPGVAQGLLEKVRRESTSVDNRACALFQLAQIQRNGATPGAAKALYQRVQSEFPTTRFAQMAERNIFEMEHLAVGKTAPNFEATDENGVKFTLSEYRGKVVVLDFWGFW